MSCFQGRDAEPPAADPVSGGHGETLLLHCRRYQRREGNLGSLVMSRLLSGALVKMGLKRKGAKWFALNSPVRLGYLCVCENCFSEKKKRLQLSTYSFRIL